MSTSLEQKILSLLAERPGLMARDVATQLGVEKNAVNSLLYGKLKTKCQQDASYRWSLKGARTDAPTPNAESTAAGPLAQLCNYYLSCLSQDEEGGVAVFAATSFGDADYCELAELPRKGTESVFSTDSAKRLLNKIRKEGGRQALYFGYPTLLRHH